MGGSYRLDGGAVQWLLIGPIVWTNCPIPTEARRRASSRAEIALDLALHRHGACELNSPAALPVVPPTPNPRAALRERICGAWRR
jgi:hypothetical protein